MDTEDMMDCIDSSINDDFISSIEQYTAKSINGKNIKLLNYNNNFSDMTLNFDVDTYPIQVTTDFEKYCCGESIIKDIDLNTFNIQMVFNKKTVKLLLDELSKININNNSKKLELYDSFHIFQKIDEFSKYPINYTEIEKSFLPNNSISSKIPKELLLSHEQIVKLILNEVKKVNRNKEYKHYIVIDPSNPYSLSIRLVLSNSEKMKSIFDYDYVELKLIIDPKGYPYIPPKIEYIKPKITLSLLLSIINLDILKLENWSPIITLEYFTTNIASELDALIDSNIIYSKDRNETNIINEELEYELVKLSSMTKIFTNSNVNNINIKIPVPDKKQMLTKNTDAYWKSGTGYGHNANNTWDIKSFIKDQEIQRLEISKCLCKINKKISDDTFNIIKESILYNYILAQIKDLNILEIQNNKIIYFEIFNILANIANKDLDQRFINNIALSLKVLLGELDMLFDSNTESLKDEFFLHVHCTCDHYIFRFLDHVEIKELQISTDIKEEYCQVMKKLQFGSYEVPQYHRFIKYNNMKPDQKSIMRILGEISSFKSGLPLNWESTIWTRVPKNNFNLFSFLISGPKDTPYENGLFEFHAYLPNDYPNTVPQVLLQTTGSDTVRFNPNLYNTGKVCLSLLGTWQAQEGESWNPKTSTFMQVMISIQSLILVEQPYFNEPGYERDMNTAKGKAASDLYNEEKEPHTIKLAMTNMIRHPPPGFEDIVINHFRMKKEEIINKTSIWVQNCSDKHRALMIVNRNELIELLDKL